MEHENIPYLTLDPAIEQAIRADRAAGRMHPHRFDDARVLRREQNPHDDATLTRPAFARDIEKILNVPAYNRYADKTQVFSFVENDDISRRGLHVQLVSRVARGIGSLLGLNVELIEAIALGHDVGHTPFGHAGERYLSACYHRRTGRYFNHNVHSVRVLDQLYRRNVSLQTLDGVLCHNGEFAQQVLRRSSWHGNGIGDQSADGHWTVACACIIEAITGNLGIAGGGGAGMVMPEPLIKTKEIDLLSDRLPESEEDKANGWMAGVSKLVAPETPRWFQDMVTQESGPTTAYNKGLQSILSEDPYPLRFVFGQSSNPMSATRQPKTIAEALKKLDYYVVMDTAWNSSCDYADIVLPATTQYESADQFATKNSPAGTFIGINQVISEPPGETRSDWQYYLDLAVKMGYGADFWDGDIDKMLNEQLDGSGVTLEELREKGYVFKERTDGAKPTEPEYQNYAKMFENLPGGKMQCANDWIGDKPNATDTGTISRLPEYKGAPESLDGTPDVAAEYPLVISDVHAYRLCNHSYYHDVPYLRELQPEPWVKINPATGAKYGIADGDWMKIESPHGSIKMVARYFEPIAPDVLMTKRGWWEPCDELGLPGYGSLDGGSEVNVLYDDDIANYDGFTSAMAKQTLVKISKSEG